MIAIIGSVDVIGSTIGFVTASTDSTALTALTFFESTLEGFCPIEYLNLTVKPSPVCPKNTEMVKNEMKSDLEVLTEYYEKTANSAEIFKSLDDKKPAEKVCLMQRDQIGNFYYSNPISQSAVEELELKREISKIKIIPTCTLKRSTSTLASKPKQSVKKLKTGVQFRPVEFKDYGLFTSFAPRFDSGMASLGSRDSTLVCKPFRKVYFGDAKSLRQK